MHELGFWSTFLSYNSYLANLQINNGAKAYEVVFLIHLRNSTGSKGTALEYFRLCETFFRKKLFPKGPPSFFWSFPTERMLKNPKGSPPFSFFGIV